MNAEKVIYHEKFQKDNNKNSKLRVVKSSRKGKSNEVYALRTEEEINHVISHFNKRIENAETPTNERVARRDRALFICGINIGIRGSDISTLKWGDVFDSNWQYKECQKIKPYKTRRTRKYVDIIYNDAFMAALDEYRDFLSLNCKEILNLDEYISFSKKGENITRKTIGKIIKKAGEESGIKQPLSSHSLRKTFAYWCYKNAPDKTHALTVLQHILGHSKITDTLKYIGLTLEDEKEMYNSLNIGMPKIEQMDN